jgi:hypothetical protein
MSFFTVLLGSKIAVGALALGTIVAGGTAAAAYTGSLPTPLQQSAHSLIGAPAPTVSAADTSITTATPTAPPTPSATPVGPDATGPAAFGLCQAYTHGGLATSSIAYASLVTAAKGAANITAYCATIASPGQSAAHRCTSAGAAKKTVAPAAPQSRSHATTGTSHKPASSGRP